MTIECDVGGCCSLPTERADCALFAVGSAARRASRRRGAPCWSAFYARTGGSLSAVEGLRRCAVRAA
jgi:hypothetical protein